MTRVSPVTGRRTAFPNVALPFGASGSYELEIEEGRICRLDHQPSKPAKFILFPPLADLHVHANRAFTIGSSRAQSLEHAIAMATDIFRRFRAREYERHAGRLFAHALKHGTTILRTHADISPDTALHAVQGTVDARETFRQRMDIELVAFAASSCDPVDPESRAMLRDAVAMGAQLLGAAPAFYAAPQASIDALLDLAIELGVQVDLHLDEHLDAGLSYSGYLADATIGRGLEGRVTLSHGCAIGALDIAGRRAVAARIARARMAVIALPTTNLYLQDRSAGAPNRRGIAPLRDLLLEGVAVRLASDNVRDAFFPYGSADLLEVAQLGSIAAHLDEAREMVKMICNGRDAIEVGAAASFVLVPGSSLTDVLAERPANRIVVRQGMTLLGSIQAPDAR